MVESKPCGMKMIFSLQHCLGPCLLESMYLDFSSQCVHSKQADCHGRNTDGLRGSEPTQRRAGSVSVPWAPLSFSIRILFILDPWATTPV